MGKIRFLIFASLLAIILGVLVVGDSPTMATEKPPPTKSATMTITMITPPLPDD